MPTYQCVEDPDCLLHLLVAREALPPGLGRQEADRWYGQLRGLLPPVTIKYQVLQATHFEWGPTRVQRRNPLEMLRQFKINCEPTDPCTGKAIQLMQKVRQGERTLLATAAVAAALNSHAFIDELHRSLAHVEVVSRRQLLREAKRIVERGELDIFTRAFNRQASNKDKLGQRKLAKTKLAKIARMTKPVRKKIFKKGSSKRVKPVMKRAVGKSIYKRTRRSLALQLGGTQGVLIGKNAFSILERHFRTSRTRRPPWCSDMKEHIGSASGSIWGPGAHSGLNAMGGRLPAAWTKSRPALNLGCGQNAVADMQNDFDHSTAWAARLKRKLRAIGDEYKVRAQQQASRRVLLESMATAAFTLACRTDCGIQFLYCELGKLAKAAINWNARYLRGRNGANGGLEAASSDSEDLCDSAVEDCDWASDLDSGSQSSDQ